jgi:hypothetical protein
MVERYTHLSSTSIKKQHTLYSPIHNMTSKMELPRKRKR